MGNIHFWTQKCLRIVLSLGLITRVGALQPSVQHFFPTGAADEGHEGAQGGNFKIRHVTKGFLLTALKMHFQFQGPQARVFFPSF